MSRSSIRGLPLAGVLAATTLVLASCGSVSHQGNVGGSDGNDSGGGKDNYTFELITKSNDSPYWLSVRNGANAAAKKLGNVKLKFQAPAHETDLKQQLSMFNNAVTAHVDGIVLAAQQPAALTGPVRNAQQGGTPVITVDSGVKEGVATQFLATSNTGAAAALAKQTARLAGGKGAYGIIDFNEVATTGQERPQGFKQGMKSFSDFHFVGMQLGHNSISQSKSKAANMIASNPDLNLIFGANDRSAVGVGQAVQSAGKADEITAAGFDADLGEIKLIKQGVIKASVLQSPYQMGYKGVMNMVKVKQGKDVKKKVDTPYFVVTPKNVSTKKAVSFIKQYIPDYGG